MAANFALSVKEGPSFDTANAYVINQLNKGEFECSRLSPSAPLAVKSSFDHVQDGYLQSLYTGVESQYLQKETNLKPTGKKSRSEDGAHGLLLINPTNGTDLSHHLLFACADGRPEVVQLVLDNASSLNLDTPLPCANNQGLTPLCVASLSNDTSGCQLLIKAGADVNRMDSVGRCALHWAVLANQLNTVKILLSNGAKVDLMDPKGLTPLHYACSLGLVQIVAALFKESSSTLFQHSPTSGITPLILACLHGHSGVVKLLLKHSPNALLKGDEQRMSSFHNAVWGGSLKCVKTLTTHSTWREGVAQRDIWGRTPLIIAAAKGDSNMCQLLLKKGARVSEVDNEGRGVLHWAILSGQLSCVDFLLKCKSGSDLCRLRDSDGATPLHYAAISRDESILAAILERCPDLFTATTTKGHTPLVWAATCAQLGCVKLLLAAQDGLNQGEDANNSYQPLHAATSVGALEICQDLLGAGYQVEILCPNGFAPLHYACRYGHTDCVKTLLSHGAKVDSLSAKQESGLHLAVVHGHSDTVAELIEQGACTDKPLGEDKNLSIHLASLHGHSQILNVILRAGTNVDQARCSDGYTPLFLAAAEGHLDCCKVLVENGAKTGTRMKSSIEGLTALNVALKNGHTGCADYLIFCHAPSGGGVHHRAAATIQAVWKYHRYKRRRIITYQWSAIVLQRCIRRWLCCRRAHKVKEARMAARHRAASIIQLNWRQFIAERRRYEATCSKLRARLRQEQMATSLIVAEIQAQAQNVSLPSTTAARIPKSRLIGAAPTSVLPQPRYLLKASSHPHGLLVLPSQPQPRRPLQAPPVSIRITDHTKSSTGKLITTPSPTHLPRIQEPVKEILSCANSSNDKIGLQLIPSNHPLTTATPPSEPQGTSESNKKISTASGDKLPILSRSNSLVWSGLAHEESSQPYDNQPTEASSNQMPPQIGASVVKSNFKLPSHPQLKFIRRSSIFKDTPLGYRQFFSRESKKSPPVMKEDLRLESHTSSPSESPNIKFTEHLQSVGPTIQESNSQDDSLDSNVGSISENQNCLLEDQAEKLSPMNEANEENLLNQVERFERLMKVLSLLKEAKRMDELEESREGAGTGGGINDLKDHIKLALDEAVRLRIETKAMQSQIGDVS